MNPQPDLHTFSSTTHSIQIDDGENTDVMVYCGLCDRHFVSDDSLAQHRRDAPVHRFCGRCDRHFPFASALDQHRRDSPMHNICFKCELEFDFEDDDDLTEHEVEKHNMCRECCQFFSSRSNLKNVRCPR